MRRIGRGILAALAFAFGYFAYVFITLPDVRPLQKTNPATTAFIELRAREARARGAEPRRVQRWVKYSRISESLKRAVLVTEDSAFWEHDGLDYQQIRESIEVNWERGEFARGASTITQQLAKNLYLSPSKNPVRKMRELLIARRLEAELSKQRILEIYLNVIEWGEGVYGAEAAARTHFGKSAAALGPQESALLAAAIANPRIMNPGSPTARLRRRQQMVLRRLGWVEPPPVGAEPAAEPVLAPVPGLPPSATPLELPGEIAPLPPVPPLKPPGPPGTGREGGPGGP